MCLFQITHWLIIRHCFLLWAGFRSMYSSLLSNQAGHPPRPLSAGVTSPQCQQVLLTPMAPGTRPWVAAVLWERATRSWRAPLIRSETRRSALRPRPSTPGSLIPSPPPRPHRQQIQDFLNPFPPLPAALWTLMLKKRPPVRKQCGQRVKTLFFSF